MSAEIIDRIKKNTRKLIETNKQLNFQVKALNIEIEQLKLKIGETEKNKIELKERYLQLITANQFAISQGSVDEAQKFINSLVREIKNSIEVLNMYEVSDNE